MRREPQRRNGTVGGRSGSPTDADFASDGVIAGGSELAEWPAPSCNDAARCEVDVSSHEKRSRKNRGWNRGCPSAYWRRFCSALEVRGFHLIKSLRSKTPIPIR